MYFKIKPETSLKEKSSLVPFTKIYGFHQIMTDLAMYCWQNSAAFCLLRAATGRLNGFTSLQCVRSTGKYASPVCLHPYFQMWHLSLLLIFFIEIALVFFKERKCSLDIISSVL